VLHFIYKEKQNDKKCDVYTAILTAFSHWKSCVVTDQLYCI